MAKNHKISRQQIPGPALRITLIYLTIGALWILLSDKLVARLGDHELVTTISILKGWLYVAVTSTLLYVLIRRNFSKIVTTSRQASASEERCRKLFDMVPVPLCYVNGNGLLADVNERFVQLFGYGHEEVPEIGTWLQLALPDAEYRIRVIEAWNTAVGTAVATGSDIEPIEFNVTCKDGTERSVLISGTTLGKDLLASIVDSTERKQTENSLEKKRAMLRTLIDTIPDLVWLKDPDGIYLACNKEFERLYGACETEIIGKCDYDFVDRELADFFRANDRKAMAAGVPTANDEWLTFAADGHRALFEAIKTPMIDSKGQLIGVLGVARDITAIKQAELALIESEQMYHSLFDNMMNGFAYCRMIFEGDSPLDFIYLTVNDAFERQTGLKDVAGRRVSEVIPGIRTSDPRLFEVYGRVAMTGKPEQIEIYVGALEQWFWISVYSPAREHFVSVFDVITERKKSEIALRESEERHRTILLTAMDGFWLTDVQGHMLEVNDAYCRMSGYNAQELLKLHISDLEVVETADDVFAHITKIIVQGEDRFESQHRRKDGSIIDVEVSAQFRSFEGGRVAVFVRDITTRKQAEKELQKKNAEIEQFIYTVSHDLRSPLVTVKTFMGYLEKDMVSGTKEQLTQDIQFIHGAADKMKLLLDELLELSRIDRISTQPVRVSLRVLLGESLDVLAGVIKEHTAEISLPETDLMLFGDRPRLCQIWQNLIENAVKYSRDDSTPRIELGMQQISGDTVFFVKDNGIGIDPQYHGKIFGIFEKLDPKSPGAGMGLSLIKRIVDKCGGRVWVESEGVGKGSCFYFTLPHAVAQD